MTQADLEAIVNALAAEWQLGGMGPDSMYGEFAIEVAKRALAARPEAGWIRVTDIGEAEYVSTDGKMWRYQPVPQPERT